MKIILHVFVPRFLMALVALACYFFPKDSQGQVANSIQYTAHPKTAVRCGPGEEYYVTSSLKQGVMVEMFHQTQDGWCGVRPPEGSFCWLAAENAYLLPGGSIAEVVGKKVPAWIGSKEELAQQFRWQVELQPSQQVRILGESNQKVDEKTVRLWYRIAPPQGEFRWIRKEDLRSTPPISDPADTRGDDETMVQQATASRTSESGVISAVAQMVPTTKETLETSTSSNSKTPGPSHSKSQKELDGKRTASQAVGTGVQNPTMSSKNQTSHRGAPKSIPKKLPQSIPAQTKSTTKSLLARATAAVKAPYHDPVQQAQYQSAPVIVKESTEPYRLQEGEYVVGEEEVVEDRVIGESYSPDSKPHSLLANSNEESFFDESESMVREGNGPHHLAHADDPRLDEWNALNANPGRVFVRPLNGILGWIGFGIAESEIIEPCETSVASSPTGTVIQSGLGRLDSLPRPNRRHRGPTIRSLLQPSIGDTGGMSRTANEPLSSRTSTSSEDFGTLTSNDLPDRRNEWSELSGYPSAPRESWHASNHASGSNVSYASSLSSPSSVAMATSQAVNQDLGSLQLTTPHLREAFFELTRVAALPSDQWDFRQLHQYASDWIERGSTALERGEARLLMERIQQFESLSLKLNGGVGNIAMGSETYRGRSGFDNVVAAGYASPVNVQSTEEASWATAPQSDASGWLAPVHTSQPGQPEFALTDASGGVIAYVVPAPGMNLRRYVKQPVAIYGVKGYLPQLASKQIIAERVVRLR